jgi:hypothetical protein
MAQLPLSTAIYQLRLVLAGISGYCVAARRRRVREKNAKCG